MVDINKGGVAVDDRGKLSFVNEVDFIKVKRFYVVENFDKNTIRAWHSHLKEEKFVFVTKGSIKLLLSKIHIDINKEQLPIISKVEQEFILSDKKPMLIHIPAGYANGFKMLEDNTKVMFFSTSTLEESKEDDYRFEWDILGEEIWKTKNR